MTERDRYFLNVLTMRFALQKVRDNILRCDCIICGDSKTKRSKKRMFFVARENNVLVYCHNCGYSTGLKSFIQTKAPDLLEEYNLFGFKATPKKVTLQNIKESLVACVPKVKEKKTFITVTELNSLSECFSTLKENHPARTYVVNRHIPFSKVRFCTNFHELTSALDCGDQYSGYKIPCMIIPFFLANDKISILQARFFDPKVKPKYLTVKLDPDVRKIYNADFVDYSKPIYVLEGPIDSMFVDNAIAMAGSDGVPEKDSDYIWAFDNEKRNPEIAAKILAHIDYGNKVIIWKKTDTFKDINEGIVSGKLDKKLVMDFLKSRTFSGLKAKLEFIKWRIK
jgi:hypothetical protein